jgi:hypothetical protein
VVGGERDRGDRPDILGLDLLHPLYRAVGEHPRLERADPCEVHQGDIPTLGEHCGARGLRAKPLDVLGQFGRRRGDEVLLVRAGGTRRDGLAGPAGLFPLLAGRLNTEPVGEKGAFAEFGWHPSQQCACGPLELPGGVGGGRGRRRVGGLGVAGAWDDGVGELVGH